MILTPAFTQLNDLENTLQRGNPAILAVNKAIAEASEQSHKISTLQARGLLDADTYTTKQREIDVRLAKLRRERRQLLKNEDIEDRIGAIKRTAAVLDSGPGQMRSFDEDVFADLVEKITVETQMQICFHLYGGIQLTERLAF